jgi:hypothetical protein
MRWADEDEDEMSRIEEAVPEKPAFLVRKVLVQS